MTTYISPQAATILFRQLAAAERNQLPAQTLLDILSQDPELFGADRGWMQIMQQQLDSGITLTAALSKIPELIPAESAALLQTAERQGKLAEVMDAMADDYAHQAEVRSTLLMALTFPSVMAFGFIVLFMALMIFVIPSFADLFKGFGADLPGMTRLIIEVSNVLSSIWWLVVLLVLAGFVAWYFDALPSQLQRSAERIGFRLPFVRNYFSRRFAERLGRWVKVSQESELLHASLRHLQVTERMQSLRDCIDELESRLHQGQPLGTALQQLPPLPMRLSLFVQLGDKMGDPQAALTQFVEMSGRDAEDAFARFERGLTLSMYLTLGVLVGVIVISIYLPIFKMGSVL